MEPAEEQRQKQKIYKVGATKFWPTTTFFFVPLPTVRHTPFPNFANMCRANEVWRAKFIRARINLLESKRTKTTALGWSTPLRGETHRVGWSTKSGDAANVTA